MAAIDGRVVLSSDILIDAVNPQLPCLIRHRGERPISQVSAGALALLLSFRCFGVLALPQIFRQIPHATGHIVIFKYYCLHSKPSRPPAVALQPYRFPHLHDNITPQLRAALSLSVFVSSLC